jgi:hypothetical protein
MRRLLTILTFDQRKLLTGKKRIHFNYMIDLCSYSEMLSSKETPIDSSQTQNPSTIDDSQLKESSEDTKTTNNDDDTKLHVARYHKSETDWDELLAQVCSSPMKEKDKCSSFCLP